MSRAPADVRHGTPASSPRFELLVRVAAGLLFAVVLLPLGATSAAAHDHTETPAAVNSMPRILSFEPPVPGLDVVVIDGGARLRLDNHTTQPVDRPVVRHSRAAGRGSSRSAGLSRGRTPGSAIPRPRLSATAAGRCRCPSATCR